MWHEMNMQSLYEELSDKVTLKVHNRVLHALSGEIQPLFWFALFFFLDVRMFDKIMWMLASYPTY